MLANVAVDVEEQKSAHVQQELKVLSFTQEQIFPSVVHIVWLSNLITAHQIYSLLA